MLLLALLFLFALNVWCTPSQVHIAVTGKSGEMIVMYSTTASTDSNVVYGTDPSALKTTVTGTQTKFVDGNYTAYIHSVHLTGLADETRYYYKVGSSTDGYSAVFNFNTKTKNITYAVYGDLGYANDLSITQLTAEVEDGVFDQVLHVGDFAYNFEDSNGQVGDEFMAQLEPVAANVPYFIAAGNHEAHDNFTEYKNRFLGVTNGLAVNSGSNTNLWYSWNAEFVHFVVIDTEMYNYSYSPGQVEAALNWLEDDLIQANKNRDQYPWIVMLGHKGSWMDTTVWTNFTALSNKYGVDIYFCGHQHNYQRLYPFMGSNGNIYPNNTYTDPQYLIQIVSGSPGNKEDISTGLGPSNFLAFHLYTYGYGHLKIYNQTHLYWEWQQTATELKNIRNRAENVKDTLWVIQHNHGMRG